MVLLTSKAFFVSETFSGLPAYVPKPFSGRIRRFLYTPIKRFLHVRDVFCTSLNRSLDVLGNFRTSLQRFLNVPHVFLTSQTFSVRTKCFLYVSDTFSTRRYIIRQMFYGRFIRLKDVFRTSLKNVLKT